MSNVIFTSKLMKIGIAAALSVSLAACEDGKTPNLFKGKGQGGGLFSKKTETSGANQGSSIKLVERDVESPEVFQVTEKALWDGRPSLGGVWVAHPDSDQPERVIIRNKSNGKFVIGALFRRERDNPGPKLQLSSDAASALGVLAGAPTTLNVTVLRRETVTLDDGGGSPATPETVTTQVLKPAPTQDIKASVLKSVAAAEAKKDVMAPTAKKDTVKTSEISRTKPKSRPAPKAKPVAKTKPAPKAAAAPVAAVKVASRLSQPFIQLGFFSVEANAKNTLKALETRKMPGRIVKATAKGKTFWRVMAGPAQTKGERDAYLKEIKKMGFADAYLTKN